MRRSLAVIVALVLASTLSVVPTIAGTASIDIDSVGGRKIVNGQVTGTLFGKTLVQGTAIPGQAAPEPDEPAPLVADAGDSVVVAIGDNATLLGAGFGGSAPYSFRWSSPVGALSGADAPTAQLATAGAAAGTYDITLEVTDSAGATASDTVRAVLFAAGSTSLLDTGLVLDPTPGVLVQGPTGSQTFSFQVPKNILRIDVVLSWTVPTNDYDVRVFDPDGIDRGSQGQFIPDNSEQVIVPDPQTGTWRAVVEKFLTAADQFRVTVAGRTRPFDDPRPTVRAGGPYRFAVGTTQQLEGTVTGGAAPLSVGWDTDQDGRIDLEGASAIASLAQGRHLVTLRVTDANGFERRETTSVMVADPTRLAAVTTPLTVVAINDSGINPYHLEFSAETYPDPEVLALTGNFTRHPSEYIGGFPTSAQPIAATLGKGYFPVDDARGPDNNGDGVPDGSIWDLRSASAPWGLEFGKLYWIPGTKIIGAYQPGPLACSNCAVGAHVILDDDGHGTGSSSVSVGNRYGYCPTCLLVLVKGLSSATPVSAGFPWVDINSNSWGTIANLPLDLVLADVSTATKPAVERGQTVLFASGNGHANAFESPTPTYGTGTTGPDWHVVVGAIRRDNSRAIVGDGTPAHLSSWGDGNLPSACRTGTVSQCAFGGTSAATPYTAGVFGHVLTQVRRAVGDTAVGQRTGQVIAEGFPVAGSAYLADGKLTRAELREVVFKTAFPLNQDNTQSIPIYPYPWTAPYNGDVNVLFEGYGAATPNSAKRALDVLLGRAALPVREAEDRWFEIDAQIRDSIWGGYDRDGDGVADHAAPTGAFGITAADVQTVDGLLTAIAKVTHGMTVAELTQQTGASAYTYWLHRSSEGEPQVADSCANGVTYMDQNDSSGDHEPCFTNRATSVLAAFRPLGMWPTATDIDFAVPAGSDVTVELYIASDQLTVARPTGVLMAGDRVLGEGAGTPTPLIGSGPWVSQGFPIVVSPLPPGVTIDQNKCVELGELCWNRLSWSFQTTRHAIPGDQLTFQVQLIGVRAWSFGYEGQHRSKITITPAPIPGGELDFGVAFAEPDEGATLPDGVSFDATGFATFPVLGDTEAGDHPTLRRVYVSVDDPTFASPIEATVEFDPDDDGRATWSAPIPGLAPGTHTIYARAQMDRTVSPAEQRSVTVEDVTTSPRVQWQIVPAGASPAADGWNAAQGLLAYAFEFDTRAFGKGEFDIYTRLIEGGLQTAITSVRARFR